jgi:succinate dehydrogenase flavin-adding protein (antitoxin of CptAB toxin-antitoxin module)
MPLGGPELRRLRWRCRRGLLENDLVLQRFLERHGDSLDGNDVAALYALLDLPDPQLWDIVSGRVECADPGLANMVSRLRAA